MNELNQLLSSNLDKDYGNAHLELQRAIIKNNQMQDAMNKALYKLSGINTADQKLNQTIDDIIAILEG